MSFERKFEQIRNSDLDNKTQIEKYQNILQEIFLISNNYPPLHEYQKIVTHCIDSILHSIFLS